MLCDGEGISAGHGACQEDRKIPRWETAQAKCRFRWQQSGELDVHSDADWGGDKATRRTVSAEIVMRGGHCFKKWTKKRQVVSLSSAESELHAAVKAAPEGLGIQSVAKDLGYRVG